MLFNRNKFYMNSDGTLLQHQAQPIYREQDLTTIFQLVSPKTSDNAEFVNILLANRITAPAKRMYYVGTEDVVTDPIGNPGVTETWNVWQYVLTDDVLNAVATFKATPIYVSFTEMELLEDNPSGYEFVGFFNNLSDLQSTIPTPTAMMYAGVNGASTSTANAYSVVAGVWTDTLLTVAEFEQLNAILNVLLEDKSSQIEVSVDPSIQTILEAVDVSLTDQIIADLAALEASVGLLEAEEKVNEDIVVSYPLVLDLDGDDVFLIQDPNAKGLDANNPNGLFRITFDKIKELIAGEYKGEFLLIATLLAAYPNGIANAQDRSGWYAFVAETATDWRWSVTGNAWQDSGTSTGISRQDFLALEADVLVNSADIAALELRMDDAETRLDFLDTTTEDLRDDLTAEGLRIDANETNITGLQTTQATQDIAIAGKVNLAGDDMTGKLTITRADGAVGLQVKEAATGNGSNMIEVINKNGATHWMGVDVAGNAMEMSLENFKFKTFGTNKNLIFVDENDVEYIIYHEGNIPAASTDYINDATWNAATQTITLTGIGLAGATINLTGLATDDELQVVGESITNHKADLNNPHAVTQAQVGLANVDNTSDLDKPISTDTQDAIDLRVDRLGDTMTGTLRVQSPAADGVALRVAALNKDTTVLRVDGNVNQELAGDYGFSVVYEGSGTGNDNDLVILGDNQDALTQTESLRIKQDGQVLYKGNEIVDVTVLDGYATDSELQTVGENIANHKLDLDNPHVVTKAQLGLENVDNTSDINKPISDLTQTALDAKLDGSGGIISNDLTIGGNLTVQGTTITVDATTVQIADKILELAKDNTAPLTGQAGIAVRKYDGINDGGILIDATGEFRVGDVTIQPDGSVVDVSTLPLLARDELVNLSDQDLLIWDAASTKVIGKTGNELGLATHTQIALLVQDLDDHESAVNPHTITATTVGLENVDNTTDLLKPISIATQSALDDQAETIGGALVAHEAAPNPHSITATTVGLGNVDNTTDLDKPVSDLTRAELDSIQAAVDLKVDRLGDTMTGTLRIQSPETDSVAMRVAALNKDTTVLRVDSNINQELAGDFGFSVVYEGTGTGNDNDLVILSDNQAALTQTEALRIKQDGQVLYKGSEIADISLLSGYATDTDLQTVGEDIANHKLDLDNPHQVNRTDVGLGITTIPEFAGIDLTTGLPTEPTHKAGRIFMDPIKHQPTIMLDNTEVRLNLGFETLVPIVNRTTTPFVSGTVIYPTGYENSSVSKFVVDRANAKDKHRISPVAVVTTPIAVGGTGYATKLGLVEHVDTSAFAVGDRLYVSEDDTGFITNVRPIAGAFPTVIGFVVVAAVDGTIQVDITESELTTEVTNRNGFPINQRFNSTMAVDNGTRTFTLGHIADYHYYHLGIKYEKTADESLVLANIEGIHAIYYDKDELKVLVKPTETEFANIVLNHTWVAAVLWDTQSQRAEAILDERHGLMDQHTHLRLHQGDGTIFLGGMTLGISNIDENSVVDLTAVEFTLSDGLNKDEDIEHQIIGKTALQNIREYAFEGPTAEFHRQSENPYGLSVGTVGRLNYNQFNGATWSVEEAIPNSYVWRHFLAIPEVDKTRTSFIAIQGSGNYDSAADAEAGVGQEKALIEANFPTPESTYAYAILYQTKIGFGNIYSSKIISLSNGDSAFDFRFESAANTSTASASSHIALSDRDAPNSHPSDAIGFTPTGTISATNVQSAIEELDTESAAARAQKVNKVGDTMTGALRVEASAVAGLQIANTGTNGSVALFSDSLEETYAAIGMNLDSNAEVQSTLTDIVLYTPTAGKKVYHRSSTGVYEVYDEENLTKAVVDALGINATHLGGLTAAQYTTDTELQTHSELTGIGGHVPSGGLTGEFLNHLGVWATPIDNDTRDYIDAGTWTAATETLELTGTGNAGATILLSGYATDAELLALSGELTAHEIAINPHGINKTTLSLQNVDNTSDAAKPVSTLQQSALDLKLDKTGGTISSDLTVGGNLVVEGTTFTVDSTTVQVSDKIIELAKGNTLPLTSYAGLAVRQYDGTHDGAMVVDSSGEFRVGDVTIEANGSITDVGTKPLLARAEIGDLAGDDIFVWDNITGRAVGKTIGQLQLVTDSDLQLHTEDEGISGHVPSGGIAGQFLSNLGTWATPVDTNDIDYISGATWNQTTQLLTLSGIGNAGTSITLLGMATDTELGAVETIATNHIGDLVNPHAVTKAQVGLANVDNTSDLAKPISTLTQTALDAKASQVFANGVATDLSNHELATNPHSITKATVLLGNVDNTSDLAKPISTATQSALNLKASSANLDAHIEASNPHSITKTTLSLQNVDNTSDLAKPISTATQTALNLKATTASISNIDNTSDLAKPVSTATQTALNLKLDKTGGTISSDLTVGGNLVVEGTTFTVDATNVQITDKIIELAKGNTLPLTSYAGLAVRQYDGTNDGAMVVNGSGEFRVGDVTIEANGSITDISTKPLLARAEIGALAADDILVWDNTTATAVGKTIGQLQLVTDSDLQLHTEDEGISGHVPSGGIAGQFLKQDGTWATPTDTDTVYSHPASHPISLITDLQTTLDAKATQTFVNGVANDLTDHELASNPHSITKATVGLGNVDNTTDLAKPISTATQSALNLKASSANLDAHIEASNPHGISKTTLNLQNVNNTSDLAKPISTLTQTALDAKVDDGQVLTNVPAGALFTDTVYTLPTATTATRGGIRIEEGVIQTTEANTATTTSSRTYGLQVNSLGQGVINVPWTDTDTVYSHPASHPISLITGLQTALDGKVDDSQVLTNVPAGALFTDTDTVYTHPVSHSIAFISGLQTTLDGKVDDGRVLTNVPAGALFTDTVYSLPAATTTVRGGIELFSDTDNPTAANAVSSTASRTYGIQLNSAGQAVVNVPWTDTNTVYTHPASHPISLITGLQTALDGKATVATYNGLSGEFGDHIIATGNESHIPAAGTPGQFLNHLGAWATPSTGPGTNLTFTRGSNAVTVYSDTGTDVVLPTSNTTEAGVMTAAHYNKLLGIADGAQVNVATNITIAEGTTTVAINSSTGTDDSIAAATTSLAGVMTAADKTKLNGIATGANVNVATNLTIATSTTTNTISSSTGTNVTIPAATTLKAGVMTAADRNKLNTIATGSNNYSLPQATSTVRGGIELFSDTDNPTAANAVSSTASRTYGIQLNSANQAVVNVPWVDTNTYVPNTETVDSSSGAVSKLLTENVYYSFTSASITTLTITLSAETAGKLNEYMFEWTSPATPTVLTAIAGVTWVGGTPVIEGNKKYNVSIVNGIGIIAGA